MKRFLILLVLNLSLCSSTVFIWAEESGPGVLSAAHNETESASAETILQTIQDLESARDPKCYATATRLENMIYGIPLKDEARFKKIDLQKALIRRVWQNASSAVKAKGVAGARVSKEDLQLVVQKILYYSRTKDEDFIVEIPSQEPRIIKKLRFSQYTSVAYALRAIFAVQQDELLLNDHDELVPLDQDAIAFLKEVVDVYTMIALDLASFEARRVDQRLISAELITKVWKSISWLNPPDAQPNSPQRSVVLSDRVLKNQSAILQELIDRKITAFAAYNNTVPLEQKDNLLFKMMSESYARAPFPKEENARWAIKEMLEKILIQFAMDVLLKSQEIAQDRRHPLVTAQDAYTASQAIAPHVVDDHETVIFFPNLHQEDKIVLANYDSDSFRDFGTHWQVLKDVFQKDQDIRIKTNLDPFATEIVTEAIAQYGVLVLRVAGNSVNRESKLKRGALVVTPRDLEQGKKSIDASVKLNAQTKAALVEPEKIISAPGEYNPLEIKEPFFSDITRKVKINFEHRLSDWFVQWINAPDEKGHDRVLINSGGVAAEDINNDGYPDILLVGGGGNQLLINDGKGHFINKTKQAGINFVREDGSKGEPRQPIIADFDNDGWQDILITYVDDQHRLYRNIDGVHFEDLSAKINLGGKGMIGGPVTVFDFDQDGLLDIYIGYYGRELAPERRSALAAYLYQKKKKGLGAARSQRKTSGALGIGDPAQPKTSSDLFNTGSSADLPIGPTLNLDNKNAAPNALLRNLGGFNFKDVAKGSGAENHRWTTAAAHTDIDGDGKQDIVVSNDFGKKTILLNKGDGRFKDEADALGITETYHSMNVGIADLNHDDFPDIYFSNINSMLKNAKYTFPNAGTPLDTTPGNIAKMIYNETSTLYLSKVKDGKLLTYVLCDDFKKGADDLGWAWDADFFDFDNDGDDDLYVLNGYNDYAQRKNLQLSHNAVVMSVLTKVHPLLEENRDYKIFFVNQDGQMVNFSDESGAKLKGYSSSAVYLDFDRDGDLDMIFNNTNAPAVFYQNNTGGKNGNHWLAVKLIGAPQKKTNRDAIGARLIAKTPSGNHIWREVRGGTGYLSMDPKQQYFGLGKDTQMDLKIDWPNGEIQNVKGLKADQFYTIKQGVQ